MAQQVIHHYKPGAGREASYDVPAGSKIISAAWRSDGPAIYVVKTENLGPAYAPSTTLRCVFHGTGHVHNDPESAGMAFIGTVSGGALVFHVYGVVDQQPDQSQSRAA